MAEGLLTGAAYGIAIGLTVGVGTILVLVLRSLRPLGWTLLIGLLLFVLSRL